MKAESMPGFTDDEKRVVDALPFPLRKLLAKSAQDAMWNFGVCCRCGLPWGCVSEHTTWITESRGCFPLCEPCWRELGTPEARLPFYRAFIEKSGGLESWAHLQAAVMLEGVFT